MRLLAIFTSLIVSLAVVAPSRSETPTGTTPTASLPTATTPADTSPAATSPIRLQVSVLDSATSTIKQLIDGGSTIADPGDSDSLATVFLFYRGAYEGDYGSSCALLSRGAVRALVRNQSPTLGAKTCKSAVAAFTPFAGDVVMADVTEVFADESPDSKAVSGGAVIHAPGRSPVRLSLRPTADGWRITKFGKPSRQPQR